MHIGSQDGSLPYAIVQAGSDKTRVFAMDTRDLGEVKRARIGAGGDFIWFKKDGKSYLVSDPAVVAKVRAAWAPSEKLGAEMDEHSKQMDLYGKRMGELSAEFGTKMAAQAQSDRQRGTQRELEVLGRTQERLGRKLGSLADDLQQAQSETRRASLQSRMAAIQKSMEPLNERMARLSATLAQQHDAAETSRAPTEALRRQMDEAQQPMRDLGRKLGELGREQGRLSRDADKATRALIDDALRNGKAEPLGNKAG